jgi:hypothetical protein
MSANGKTLIALLAAMAALVGGQAVAPAPASAMIEDGGGDCPDFLPLEWCAGQEEDEGGGGGEEGGGGEVIVIVEDVDEPDDGGGAPYDPGGRPIGTPPSPVPGEDGPIAQGPRAPAGGGGTPAKTPPPKKPLSQLEKWEALPEEQKGNACMELEFARTNVTLALDAFDSGNRKDATEQVYVPGKNGRSGHWEWRPFKSREEIIKRRSQLSAEWRWKNCNRWHPDRRRGAGPKV